MVCIYFGINENGVILSRKRVFRRDCQKCCRWRLHHRLLSFCDYNFLRVSINFEDACALASWKKFLEIGAIVDEKREYENSSTPSLSLPDAFHLFHRVEKSRWKITGNCIVRLLVYLIRSYKLWTLATSITGVCFEYHWKYSYSRKWMSNIEWGAELEVASNFTSFLILM